VRNLQVNHASSTMRRNAAAAWLRQNRMPMSQGGQGGTQAGRPRDIADYPVSPKRPSLWAPLLLFPLPLPTKSFFRLLAKHILRDRKSRKLCHETQNKIVKSSGWVQSDVAKLAIFWKRVPQPQRNYDKYIRLHRPVRILNTSSLILHIFCTFKNSPAWLLIQVKI